MRCISPYPRVIPPIALQSLQSYSPSLSTSTPPPLKHAGSPYCHIPLPPVSGLVPAITPRGSVLLHHLLGLSQNPAIDLDFSHRLLIISPSNHRTPSSFALSDPATKPPLPCLTVFSAFLRWSITVLPSSDRIDAFVTVLDVLADVHRALHVNATLAEYNDLPSSEVQYWVNTAFEHRCQQIKEGRDREVEMRKGVQRVDFLMGRTRFLGLSCEGEEPGICELNVRA